MKGIIRDFFVDAIIEAPFPCFFRYVINLWQLTFLFRKSKLVIGFAYAWLLKTIIKRYSRLLSKL